MEHSFLSDFIAGVVVRSPVYVVVLVGIILAIIRWDKHPWASTLIVICLPAWLLTSIGFAAIFALLPWMLQEADMDFASYTWFYRGVGIGEGIFDALVMAILLLAIFLPRPATAPK